MLPCALKWRELHAACMCALEFRSGFEVFCTEWCFGTPWSAPRHPAQGSPDREPSVYHTQRHVFPKLVSHSQRGVFVLGSRCGIELSTPG